jgi:hypothetical protein
MTQRPAVTKVLLCTSALTGVGAAIAAGSQLIKGNWALLVKAARIHRIQAHLGQSTCHIIESDPKTRHIKNKYKKITSPIRLVNSVIKEHSTEFLL